MADTWIGKQIDHYKLTKILSDSQRSCLYLAQEAARPDHVVVLKRLKCQLDDYSKLRFLKEAGYLPKVRHPFILPILQIGVEERYPFVIAEYAPGGSLRDKLVNQRGQILPIQEIEQLLTQITQGLQGAWPISHRDLKPETILFDAQGNVQLAYFYLMYFYYLETSLHSASDPLRNMLSQTLLIPYIDPAMLTKQLPNNSLDQYSLGSIAYELFTGQKPFGKLLESLAQLRAVRQTDQQDVLTTIVKYLKAAPISPGELNPTLPHFREQAILKAMAKDPEQRYPEISDFLAALFPVSGQQ